MYIYNCIPTVYKYIYIIYIYIDMDMRTMHKGHNTVTILAKNQNMLSDPRLPELQGE